ncbi:16S rRNA (uracil(1498)-N(3))-methyltransferase [Subtercola boreus]|uniref:Ribosomal RNA small subunit methyltransferase E n=1 Tax=Subtercola boreus TaxID=120213 RepID=A0A3E0WBK7_9MICO|nr:16S rRNA (uracil(1498)-N(3))-methyltransferase [Subtercola boreus]RFA21814.1 16S rRNA (uracil(1498)-N(3))-methyltransferase [Subtercola boreus]RFA21925.1 16S rRNA (uracil(1498)-N(3))-methyltransferase [Subtercola boreus]RFA27873.1 16S rRNA (uracil(1498)-N(3))-methyltransferase [Subtercola boreus]
MSSLFIREDLAVIPHGIRDVVSLHGDEQKHAVTVNRIRVGEETSIGDGRGLVVSGPVIAVSSTVLSIAVTSLVQQPAPVRQIWLVQALAKGDRDELAVQAATELGVARVLPWAAERSVSRWVGPKIAKGLERWRTIVREATKQSIRAWVPEVGELQATKDLLELARGSRMLVLDPTAAISLTAAEPGAADEPVVLVVGPEGGLTTNELTVLAAAGATRVSLGTGILRTSTAGPAAIAALNVTLGLW